MGCGGEIWGFEWGFDILDRFSRVLVSSRSSSKPSSEELIVIIVGVGVSWVVFLIMGVFPMFSNVFLTLWIVVSSNLSFELLFEDPIVVPGDTGV